MWAVSSLRVLGRVVMVAVCAVFGVACERQAQPPAGGPLPSQGDTTMSMTIGSDAFVEGQAVPQRHSGDGEDVSPGLRWSNLPAGTKELALICDDPDAPTPQPWVHWVIYCIPPDATGLTEGVPRKGLLDDPPGAMQGINSWPSDNVGYRGPAPPPGHGVHHYHFKLYALDAELGLKSGLTKEALLKAMDGHVLGQGELIGTYQR